MKKHFETFKGVNACNKNKKDNMTTDWEKVKCGRCKKNDEYKQARQLGKYENDHPNFRKSLADKIDMKLEVTPEESKQVQEICFSEGIEWSYCGRSIEFTNFPTIGIRSACKGSKYSICHSPNAEKYKQFSFKDDFFIDRGAIQDDRTKNICKQRFETNFTPPKHIDCNIKCVDILPKQELSACGKTLDEFMEACNNDLSNVETDIFGEWTKTMNYKKSQINNCKLGHYRIKESQNLSACGRDVDEFIKACKDDCSNVFIVSLDIYSGFTKKQLIKAFKESPSDIEIYSIKEPNNVEVINKPPLGLAPLYIHNENRLDEIREAFTRYIEAKKDIPSEWVSEYLELIKKIKGV